MNGEVLYAKDAQRVVTFYRDVTGLNVARTAADHVVLKSPAFQLVVLEASHPLAETIAIADPPHRRENTSIKLVFFAESIADARKTAGLLGGGLNAAEHEWKFEGSTVCDGYDLEGNSFQLRESE